MGCSHHTDPAIRRIALASLLYRSFLPLQL
jgi:hypothetical protein